MKAMLIPALLLSSALATEAKADDFLVAHFPFDGNLQDTSGKKHQAAFAMAPHRRCRSRRIERPCLRGGRQAEA